MSTSIWPKIRDTKVPAGGVHIWWLLQAGFVIKSPSGTMVAIDPYLTNSVQTSYGVSRGHPAPVSPEECEFDAVMATHPHDDHQDPPTLAGKASTLIPTLLYHSFESTDSARHLFPIIIGARILDQ